MNDNLKDPFKTILNNILYANGFEFDESNENKKDSTEPNNKKPSKEEGEQEEQQK